MRVSKLAALKMAAISLTVLTVALLTKPVWAGQGLPSGCVSQNVVTGWGCISQPSYCTYWLLKPNWETTWQSTVTCCYNPTSGNLISQTLSTCITAMDGNCCWSQDTISKCTATGCPTTQALPAN